MLDCDRIVVEGDWSTAAFPVAASIASGKAVTLMGLNALSVQADRALENILGTLGHHTEWREGMFEVIPGTPRAQKIEIDLADCPDLFPALCTVAALQGGGVSLRGAPQLTKGIRSDLPYGGGVCARWAVRSLNFRTVCTSPAVRTVPPR